MCQVGNKEEHMEKDKVTYVEVLEYTSVVQTLKILV